MLQSRTEGKMTNKRLIKVEKARDLARRLVDHLEARNIPVTVCGSVRRRRNKVRDLDLVVLAPIRKVITILEDLDGQKADGLEMDVTCLSNRDNVKKQVDFLINKIQVNVYIATEENVGAMILFLTGSKTFNIRIRGHAKGLGYKLNQFGLWHNEELIAGRFERQIFTALGLHWVDPEQREFEDGGELEEVTG